MNFISNHISDKGERVQQRKEKKERFLLKKEENQKRRHPVKMTVTRKDYLMENDIA